MRTFARWVLMGAFTAAVAGLWWSVQREVEVGTFDPVMPVVAYRAPAPPPPAPAPPPEPTPDPEIDRLVEQAQLDAQDAVDSFAVARRLLDEAHAIEANIERILDESDPLSADDRARVAEYVAVRLQLAFYAAERGMPARVAELCGEILRVDPDYEPARELRRLVRRIALRPEAWPALAARIADWRAEGPLPGRLTYPTSLRWVFLHHEAAEPPVLELYDVRDLSPDAAWVETVRALFDVVSLALQDGVLIVEADPRVQAEIADWLSARRDE